MVSSKLKRSRLFFIVLLTGFLLTACGGGGSGDSAVSSSEADQGTLQLALVDASSGSYKAVYVTIARVEVHLGGDEDDNGNWLVVAEPNKTYNLLELVNGVFATLSEDDDPIYLDAGLYSQMRLIIELWVPSTGQNILSQDHPHANYVIDEDDNEIHKLKVPSDVVKIVKGFEINANQTTELILDFDAMRSVVTRGNSGKDYILKPTIKVRTESEAVIVKGTVTDDPVITDPPTASIPLAGSLVTAQTTEELAVDPKDEVVIETGTIAADNGEYALFIAPGNYNFVATSPGYDPACVTSTLSSGDSAVIDFGLVENDPLSGTVSVEVTITGNDEQYATVDFRREIDCTDDDLNTFSTWVTVATINIANDSGTITLDLPVGDYEVIASSYGLETQVQPVTVESEQDTPVEITFD